MFQVVSKNFITSFRWPVAAVVVLALVLNGCANFSLKDVYSNPTFKYQSTEITSVSFSEINATSIIQISNPNPYDLPITALKAELWLEGSPWLSLNNSAINGLPASGRANVDFNWALVFAKLLNQAKSVYDEGEAEFTLKLEPTFNVPLLGPQSVAWSSTVTLPVPKVPKLSLNDWSIKSFNFTSLVIALDVGVSNPNVFSMQASNWNVKLNNASKPTLAEFSLPKLDVASKGTSSQKVELTLSLADIGLSLFNGLRQNRWPDSLGLSWSGDWSSTDLDFELPKLSGSANLND